MSRLEGSQKISVELPDGRYLDVMVLAPAFNDPPAVNIEVTDQEGERSRLSCNVYLNEDESREVRPWGE